MTRSSAYPSMGLQGLSTPLLLQTSTDQLIADFYEPALRAANRYDRGVGYFTSGWLRMASAGLSDFATREGEGRFIVSPHLSPEDWEAIRAGTETRRDEAFRDAMETELAALVAAGVTQDIVTLGRMVADGVLQFKIAVPQAGLTGDFHDKFGIFEDATGAKIAFHGSQNDSVHAFTNFESISLFYSWLGEIEAERVALHASRFDLLWEGLMPSVQVLPIPEAIKEGFRALGRSASSRSAASPSKPDPRWRHQDEAVDAFLAAGAGVLEMATGTGKTRTALRIIDHLAQKGAAKTVVVTMSGTDLLDQWFEELVRLDEYVVHRAYGDHQGTLAFLNHPEDAILLVSRQNLAHVLPRLNKATTDRALIVCDEVHGMGSAALVTTLAGEVRRFRYRLGLSATPEREYDEAGSLFIEDEIGPVIFRFGLEDAIRRGILCELDYVPLHYDFSDEDKAAVRRAIAGYHAKCAAGENPGPESLYREIARVGKTSLSKLPAFAKLVQDRPEILHRSVLFVDNAAYGLKVQEIVLPIASRYHTYYAEDDRANLVRFARGDLDALITCHRISEGIDIQSVNSVVLFASARSRLETVQRLGRCLRKDPSNPAKRATVVDFIRADDIPEEGDEKARPTADQSRRDWLETLAKVREDG